MLLFCREERGFFKSEMFSETTLILRRAVFRAVRLQVGDIELAFMLVGLLLQVGHRFVPAGVVERRDRRGKLPQLQLPAHGLLEPPLEVTLSNLANRQQQPASPAS